MNQNKIVAFSMAGIVAISIVAMAMPALGGEDKAKVEEEPEVVIDKTPGSEPEQKKPEEPDEIEPEVREPDPYFNPVFREVVIVYFNEMPASLDEFASDYGVTLIFVKEDIKMAAFETEPSSMPMETSQRTLDFVEEVSKDPCVEKAYEDGFMFVRADKVYTPEPRITYPADFERKGIEYVLNRVDVGFWRLPPSLEEFASRHGATLVSVNEVLLAVTFETNDVTGFVKKISTGPYVSYAEPVGIGHICYTPNGPKKISTGPYVLPIEPDSNGIAYTPNDPKRNRQWGPNKRDQRIYIAQKQGNTGKTTRVSRTTAKELPVVHNEIPVAKVVNISERGGEALYKYPQKNKEVMRKR